MIKPECKRSSRANRGWAIPGTEKDDLQVSGSKTGMHNALVVMLCALGLLCLAAATIIAVEVEHRRNVARKQEVRYLQGSGICVVRFDSRWS